MRVEDITVWVCCPPDRPHWQAKWPDPDTGRIRTCSLKTADEAEARERAAEVQANLRAGLPPEGKRAKVPWDEFRARFLAEHGAGLRPATVTKLGRVMGTLEAACAPSSPRAVDAGCLRRLVQWMHKGSRRRAGKPYAPHTIKSYLGDVRTMLQWAKGEGMIDAVPEMPKVKVPRITPRPASRPEYDRLLAAMPSDDFRAVLMLGWHCGLRLAEAMELRREESSSAPWLSPGPPARVWLPHGFTKGHADSWLPCPVAMLDALAVLPGLACGRFVRLRWPRGQQPMQPGEAADYIGRRAREAGLEHVTMQSLRRAFISRLAAVHPAAVVMRLARHTRIDTTVRYYVAIPDSVLEAAVKSLE